MRNWIDSKELADLARAQPMRVAVGLLATWGCILLALQGAIWIHHVVFATLTFVFVGCLQNALIQWRHEASHYNLTRNRRWNDCVGDLLVAGPMGGTVARYRWHHLPHHVHLNDPSEELQHMAWICVRGKHLLWELASHMACLPVLLGGGGKNGAYMKSPDGDMRYENRPRATPASLLGFVLVNSALFVMCALQGIWYDYFLLWVAPLLTVAQLLNNFRTIVEHQPSSDVCDAGKVPLPAITRVVHANVLERFLVAPVGFYYHHEHHLYPNVPHYRLKKLRRLLQERGYFDKEKIVHTNGYVKTIWKLAMRSDYGIRIVDPTLYPQDH